MNRSERRNAAASLSLFIVRLYCSILFKLILLLWLFYGRFKLRGRKKKKEKKLGKNEKKNEGKGEREERRVQGRGQESSAGYSD